MNIIKTIEHEYTHSDPYIKLRIAKRFRWKYLLFFLILLGMFFLYFYLYSNDVNLMVYPFFIMGIMVFILLYSHFMLLMPTRSILKKNGIPHVKKGFLKGWSNDEYIEFFQEVFIARLHELGILSQNHRRNQIILEKLYKSFMEIANSRTPFDNLIIGGGLFVVYSLSFWNKFVEVIFSSLMDLEIQKIEYYFIITVFFFSFITASIFFTINIRSDIKKRIEKRNHKAKKIAAIFDNTRLKNIIVKH